MKSTASIVAVVMAAIAFAAALSGCPPAVAQTAPSEEAILRALGGAAPSIRSRGLGLPVTVSGFPAPPTAAEKATIEAVRAKASRGITVEERAALTDVVARKPTIDIEINFEFNSAAIGPQAVPALLALGRALSNPALAGRTFLLAGHTDGKGSAAYNLGLSERRAEAVRSYIVGEFKLPSDRIIAVGYGFERLKVPGAPLAAENRRVQVVNLGE